MLTVNCRTIIKNFHTYYFVMFIMKLLIPIKFIMYEGILICIIFRSNFFHPNLMLLLYWNRFLLELDYDYNLQVFFQPSIYRS